MGYIVIKPIKGGVKPLERIYVKKDRIHFSKTLATTMGLFERQRAVIILVDKDTKAVCFDIKDKGQMRDSFPVSLHVNQHNSVTATVYCRKFIEEFNVPLGTYKIASKDGDIWKTDLILPL